MSPSRWLLQRRSQDAYNLMKEKGYSPSQVYLEVGFEDLSHFSFAFKKQYGMAPSKLGQLFVFKTCLHFYFINKTAS